MQNEFVKKLTGKNPQDFESAATHIINNADIQAFQALVDQCDFLFDFIKNNVSQRLEKAINQSNYKNLMQFLKIYSYDFENVIVSSLVKFADEDLTDEMLDRLENGTETEKAYAAKYFASVNDPLSLELLNKYAYSEFEPLAINCAEALGAMKDEASYNLALEKIKSEDEFEKLSAAKFLVAYKNKDAISVLLETMKKSSMPENIASEIGYLKSFEELLETEHKNDAILALNYIINGLGEIIGLSQVFDFQLFEILENLSCEEQNSKISTLLLNAKLKFEQLTENDEYLFDEDKNTKEEILAIKNMLDSQVENIWEARKKQFQEELNSQSDFVFSALELVLDLNLEEAFDRLKELLFSKNQTIILKTVEVIKHLNKLSEIDKNSVLASVSDENIKAILGAMFAS